MTTRVRPLQVQVNAAAFASTPAQSSAAVRHDGVRAALDLLRRDPSRHRAGARSDAVHRLARSVESQARMFGVAAARVEDHLRGPGAHG